MQDFRIILLFFAAFIILISGIIIYIKSRVTRTEIFVGLLWLILFVHIFDSHTPMGLILNISILVSAIIFGYILIRSVTKETIQRERLEELSRELVATNEELQRIDKTKSDFISIVSHQLRSPLSMIKGYVSMAIEGNFGKLSVGLYEKLQRVYESNERLVRLVGDLLDLTRIEKGEIKYKFSEFRLEQLLENILDEFKANIRARNFKIVKDLDPHLPVLYADEAKIRQVFANLIDNAIHYTPVGSGKITISVKKSSDDKKVTVIVKDAGIGMNQEDLHHIFTQFGRGSSASRYYTEGLGIGLFVAKKVIGDHHGKIWAESEGSGKGSTFFVELPFNKDI